MRAINDLRKEAGFAIADRVTVQLDPPTEIADAIETHNAWIAQEVLATEVQLAPGGTHEVTVDGATFPVTLTRS